jgi:hypothetical protein
MSTAVVVATIVNTNLSEAGFRQHVVDQLRVNDRSLMDRLADADGDAHVVTAVLNVDEFLAYLIQRFPKAVDAAIATDKGAGTSVDTSKMSEGEFMDFMLRQLDSGNVEPLARFDDSKWNDRKWDDGWDEDGDIGEDISRYPFFY